MAELSNISKKNISILDPGAGIGILSVVLIEKLINEGKVKKINLLCYETDNDVLPYLGEEYGFSFAGFKPINIPLAVIQSRAEPVNLSFPEMFACVQITDKPIIKNIVDGLWRRMADGINNQVELMGVDSNRPSDIGFSRAGDEQTLPVKEGEEDSSNVLEEQVSSKAVSVESSNFSGIDIHSLELLSGTPFSLWVSGDVLSPSYCFLGDYLVIWTSTDTQNDEDGVSVIIRDATTNEVLWKYDFPYQEEE